MKFSTTREFVDSIDPMLKVMGINHAWVSIQTDFAFKDVPTITVTFPVRDDEMQMFAQALSDGLAKQAAEQSKGTQHDE